MLRFNLSCVLERAVTVCIDDACVARCAEEGVPECVRYAEVDVGQMAEAVDRSKAYNRIMCAGAREAKDGAGCPGRSASPERVVNASRPSARVVTAASSSGSF